VNDVKEAWKLMQHSSPTSESMSELLNALLECPPDSFDALDIQLESKEAKDAIDRVVKSKLAQRTGLPSIQLSIEGRNKQIDRSHLVIDTETNKIYKNSVVLNGLLIIREKLEADAEIKYLSLFFSHSLTFCFSHFHFFSHRHEAAIVKQQIDQRRIEVAREAADERLRLAQLKSDQAIAMATGVSYGKAKTRRTHKRLHPYGTPVQRSTPKPKAREKGVLVYLDNQAAESKHAGTDTDEAAIRREDEAAGFV
jgi:hypothetical protein